MSTLVHGHDTAKGSEYHQVRSVWFDLDRVVEFVYVHYGTATDAHGNRVPASTAPAIRYRFDHGPVGEISDPTEVKNLLEILHERAVDLGHVDEVD